MIMPMRTPILAILLLGIMAFTGCASFNPRPIDESHLWQRAQIQEQDGLRVSVTVTSREETRQTFGVDLEKKQIQPVWVRIENHTDNAFWFMLHALDNNYYSPMEASY